MWLLVIRGKLIRLGKTDLQTGRVHQVAENELYACVTRLDMPEKFKADMQCHKSVISCCKMASIAVFSEFDWTIALEVVNEKDYQ